MITFPSITTGASKITSKKRNSLPAIRSITRSSPSRKKNTWSTSLTKTTPSSASPSNWTSARQSSSLSTISAAISTPEWYALPYPENKITGRHRSVEVVWGSLGAVGENADQRVAEASIKAAGIHKLEIRGIVLRWNVGVHSRQYYHKRQLSHLQS